MKVLAIGAHQDDNELRVGGMAKKWVDAGHEVRFLSMTNGNAGHHILSREELQKTRAKESAEVAKLLGITYDVWDIDDAYLTADKETRDRLIRYIREYSPDLIICHRSNDYHTDHRASGVLVQDASYLLAVPLVCPDTPAMRSMPVILHNLDFFKYPPFEPTFVLDIDDAIDVKLQAAHLNTCQVYEWLPYINNSGEVPEGDAERFEWLKGMDVKPDTTDDEVRAAKSGYMVRFAKVAARFRQELIARYGEEKGSRVRFAEVFELSEYGAKPSQEMLDTLLNF